MTKLGKNRERERDRERERGEREGYKISGEKVG